MAAVPAKKMLERLLVAGTLTAKDREAFEGMWDGVHRYGKLSSKQLAWIESAFYAMEKNPAVVKKRSPKVGFITSSKVTRLHRAMNFDQFLVLCPEATSETPLYKKVREFFASGGEMFEIRPK